MALCPESAGKGILPDIKNTHSTYDTTRFKIFVQLYIYQVKHTPVDELNAHLYFKNWTHFKLYEL